MGMSVFICTVLVLPGSPCELLTALCISAEYCLSEGFHLRLVLFFGKKDSGWWLECRKRIECRTRLECPPACPDDRPAERTARRTAGRTAGRTACLTAHLTARLTDGRTARTARRTDIRTDGPPNGRMDRTDGPDGA